MLLCLLNLTMLHHQLQHMVLLKATELFHNNNQFMMPIKDMLQLHHKDMEVNQVDMLLKVTEDNLHKDMNNNQDTANQMHMDKDMVSKTNMVNSQGTVNNQDTANNQVETENHHVMTITR